MPEKLIRRTVIEEFVKPETPKPAAPCPETVVASAEEDDDDDLDEEDDDEDEDDE